MTELAALPEYERVLRDHISSLAQEDSIDLFGLPVGTYGGNPPMATLHYPYGFFRALAPVLNNVVKAEAEGYDAFLMGSFVAPLLREARSAVDITVTSMTESALLTAWSLARKVALICISDDQVATTMDLVEQLGLGSRVAATCPLDEPVSEDGVSEAIGAGGGPLLASFQRAARSALASGADLIIPAEGILSETVRLGGVRDIDGAPVVDVVEIAVAHTAFLSRLNRSGAARTARRWSYPKLLH